jgi:hypothetical protein
MVQEEQSYLVQFANFHDDYVTRNIVLADNKAGVLATATAGLLGFLLNQAQFRSAVAQAAFTVDGGLSRAAVITLALTFILAFMVIAPRIDKSADSPVNFAEVAKLPSGMAFMADLQRRGPDGITKSRILNCYDTSRVCALKYAFLRKAMFAAALAALLTAIGFLKFGA